MAYDKISIINMVLCYIVSIPFWILFTLVYEMAHAGMALIGGGNPRIYLFKGCLKKVLR